MNLLHPPRSFSSGGSVDCRQVADKQHAQANARQSTDVLAASAWSQDSLTHRLDAEWMKACHLTTKLEESQDALAELGQALFYPPNVKGWMAVELGSTRRRWWDARTWSVS